MRTAVPPPPPSQTAPCPHAAVCGGCDMQDIIYEQQVAFKQASILSLFGSLVQNPETVLPLIASTRRPPLFYRNKIRYGFVEVEGTIVPSRHAKQEANADIPIYTCLLQSEASVELAEITASIAQKYGWSLFNSHDHTGFLKHLLVREGKRTNEYMVGLVTSQKKLPNLKEWVEALTASNIPITSIYHCKTWDRDNTQREDILIWGEPVIHEQVGDFSFAISPTAFFQTNSEMVETLYRQITSLSNLTRESTVWDLYAGSASIGIFLSPYCKQVISVESNPQNIADGQINIEENDINNVSLYSGTVEKTFTSQFIHSLPKADTIVIDPPRAGLSPFMRQLLPHLPSHRLVYVSCNPLTAQRDCQELIKQGYRLSIVQGIDMFPYTYHCEVILVLEK